MVWIAYHTVSSLKRKFLADFLAFLDLSRLFSVAQGLPLADQNLPVIAGEGVFHQGGVRLGREQRDHWYEDQPGQHTEGPGVDGGAEQGGEAGLEASFPGQLPR